MNDNLVWGLAAAGVAGVSVYAYRRSLPRQLTEEEQEYLRPAPFSTEGGAADNLTPADYRTETRPVMAQPYGVWMGGSFIAPPWQNPSNNPRDPQVNTPPNTSPNTGGNPIGEPVNKSRSVLRVAAINMPRGHNDVIRTGWPERAFAANRICREANIDVVGFAEFPSRASHALRLKGMRVSPGRPNDVTRTDALGNAIGWYNPPVTLVDYYRIRSAPYVDKPKGRKVLTFPVRLLRAPNGKHFAVIAIHLPIPRNIDAVMVKGMSPEELVDDMAERVMQYARKCHRAGIPVVMPGDYNKAHDGFTRRGAESGGASDVQHVLGFGVDFVNSGTLDTRGIVTDHVGGSPWAAIKLPPPRKSEKRVRLPR